MSLCITAAAGYAHFEGEYYPFTIFQPNGKVTLGVPPILVEKNKDCQECGRVHDIEVCPLCGSFIFLGFGFLGGGLGEYKICDADTCPWIYKVMSDD